MEALVDLTGGSVHSIDLTQCRGDKINAAWAQLQAHMKANALVAVMSLDEEGDYSQDGDTVSQCCVLLGCALEMERNILIPPLTLLNPCVGADQRIRLHNP